jgi:phosphatidylserine decarboxylase
LSPYPHPIIAREGWPFAFIRFGSRVDVYLPLDAEVTAAIGEKVYAAKSVLARLSRHG